MMRKLWGYLPLVLMMIVCLASWWWLQWMPKVQRTMVEAQKQQSMDYYMKRFSVQRFSNSGELRQNLHGVYGEHYSPSDILLINDPRLWSVSDQPPVIYTEATGKRARVHADGSEAELFEQVVVVRTPAEAGQEPTRFEGEYLHIWSKEKRMESNLPVLITRPNGDKLVANQLRWNQKEGIANLDGRVNVTLVPVSTPN